MEGGHETILIFVRAETVPGCVERLLQPFTVAGLVPVSLSLRANYAGISLIAARFASLDYARALIVAAKLRSMPSTRGVRISFGDLTTRYRRSLQKRPTCSEDLGATNGVYVRAIFSRMFKALRALKRRPEQASWRAAIKILDQYTKAVVGATCLLGGVAFNRPSFADTAACIGDSATSRS